MPPRTSTDIRNLLTASELALVKASEKPAITQLSADQLKKKIERSRQLRDKWTDLATRQRRERQRSQGSRVTDAAARSQDKSKLMSQALASFEKRLEQVESVGAVGRKAGTAEPARPTKKKRARGHRAARAEVRSELEQQRSKLAVKKSAKKKSTSSATAKKTATKKSATKKSAAKKAPTKKMETKKTTSKKVAVRQAAVTKSSASAKSGKAAKKKSTRTTAVSGKAATSGSAPASPVSSGLNLNRLDQLASKAEAKQARVKESGLDSRVRGHVSARNRRGQTRRDSRN